jgi:hypothetical protein
MTNEVQELGGYVYIYTNPRFPTQYKIGRSVSPRSRLSSINVCIPENGEMIVLLKTKHYVKLEKTLHLRYKDKRVKGEYYNLDAYDLEDIITKYGDIVVDAPVIHSKLVEDEKSGSFLDDVKSLFEVRSKIPVRYLYKKLVKIGYDLDEIDYLLKAEDSRGNMMYIISDNTWMVL